MEKTKDENDRIVLGRSTGTGSIVTWSPYPSAANPNPHVLIVGGSGSGKTYATLCLLAELSRRGLPSIVIDYGQGFSRKALPDEFVSMVQVREIEVARDGIAMNPLSVLPGDVLGPVNVGQRFADTVQRIYSQIGIQQHAALRDAIIVFLESSGIRKDDPSSWERVPPRFSELRTHLQELAADKSNPGRRYVSSVEAHISSLFVFNTFRRGGQQLDWSSFCDDGAVTVLQLRGLESTLSRVITEFLLWGLIGYVERSGPGKMRCFVSLDEAHNLPMSEGSPVEKLLREGRKYGVGLILASQQPEDFSRVVYGNTSLKLLFRLEDPSRLLVSNVLSSAATVTQLKKVLRTLTRGCAFVSGSGRDTVVAIDTLKERRTAQPN
ncbi:MAG: DUF87 domain-containing protein, partial [Myxococcota bacterium]